MYIKNEKKNYEKSGGAQCWNCLATK